MGSEMCIRDSDYIVVGAGSGGVRFARLMASHGKKVCIVEKNRIGEPVL